jgi:hypothetical protein
LAAGSDDGVVCVWNLTGKCAIFVQDSNDDYVCVR